MDRILTNSSTAQTGKDDIIHSIDNNQRVISETSYLIMEDLSGSSLNHKTKTYTSPHCANNISQCPSTSESTSEAKLVRKKGRPPKAGKQVTDIFNCNVCTKTFNNSSGLVKHYVTHSAERKFVCSECSKTFKRQDHLTGHMLTHSDVKPFVCQKCAKSYCDSRSLKRHIELYHHSECNEIMISPSQTDALLKNSSIYEPYLHVAPLVSMMRDEFHEDVECLPESSCSTLQMHLCRICGHTFKSMQALNGHMQFHTNSTLKKDDEETNSGASNQDIEASFHDSTPLNIKSYVPICSSKILLMQHEKSSNNMFLSSKQDKRSDNFSASLFPSAVFSNNINCIASTSTFSSPPSCGSGIEKLAEMESIIFADKQQQSFILETDQSYSMQLQNLAQNIKPGLLLHQQQSKQFPKILNLNQGLNTSMNQRHNTSYTLLHSLLMQKNDKQQRLEQTSQTPKFPSLRSSLHSSQIHEVSNKDNDFSKKNEQALLISYSEDVNFEGLGLDSDGIEKLLVQSAIQDPKEEHVHIDENLIPEDLRNIPTHALQLFSMSSSSRSGTPPPLLDRLGNEIRTDDLLNQEFPIATDEFEQVIEGTDIEDKDVEPVLLSYDNSSSSLSTSWNERLMNNDIFSKIDSDHKDTSPTSKDKILEERFLNFSNKAGFEQLELNNIMAVSYPKKPSTEPKNFEKFRNPGLLKMKRRHWPGPLIIPPSSANAGQNLYRGSSSSGSSNFAFQSRLRSPRIIPGSGSFDSSIPPPFNLPFVPYTPPPMLSPVRNASGLFCLIQAVLATQTPPGHKIHKIANSPDLFDGLVEEVVDGSAPDEPLASDIKPHINEGPEYQALIPDCEANHMSASKICDHAEMLWNPSTLQDVAENEVKAFLEFSSCAAIPFNGCNKELAFHILYLFDGDIKRACLAIMDSHPLLATNHFMDDFKYSETSMWSPTEIDKFSCSMLKNNKDFFVISKEIGTKSCKECIEFYYVWKKVCSQENMRLKSLRRRNDNIYNNLRSKTTQQLTPIEHESNCTSEPIPSSIWKSSPIPESFYFPFIPIPESSQRQQNIKLSQKTSNPKRQSKQKVGNKSRRSRSKLLQISPTVTDPDTSTIFPCKICKKVFYKVKSRSAHMKTHRMQAKKPLPSPSFTYNHYNNFMQQQISPHDKILPERNM